MKLIKILFIILFGFGISFNTRSQETFIYPDPTLVVLPGTFEININVDDGLVNFRGYRFVFSYDSAVMYFISAEKGPLMQGFSSYWWRVFNVSPDSLHIECMIFGAGLCVSGPGTVLKLTFQSVAEDTTLLEFKDHVFYDVDGGIIPGVTATDGTIIVEYANQYNISGTVTDSASGTGLSDVLIEFDNNGGSSLTNSQGYYSHQVIEGWSGTATPSSDGYHFSPVSRSYNNVVNNHDNEDFSGALNTYTISGNIYDQTGDPCCGVCVYFSNGIEPTTSDSNGFYNQSVQYGWSGTVTPCKAGFTFTPQCRSFINVTSNLTNVDFLASQTSQTFTISGTIIEASNGLGINNVTLTFSNNGGATTTNQTGYYCHEVSYGWSGAVTPTNAEYIFVPKRLTFLCVTSNHPNQNFVGTIAYYISGTITDPNIGHGIPEVVIEFSNNAGSTIANPGGFYSHKVGLGWSGTATPSLGGYTFIPGSMTYNNVLSNQSDQDYSGTADNLILNDTVIAGTTKYWGATNSITASGGRGSFITEPGGTAVLIAGSVIYLKPGFHAREGCEFHAYIDNNMRRSYTFLPEIVADKNIINPDLELIRIYPNPFINKTNIEFYIPEDYITIEINIYDFTGKIITSYKLNNKSKGTYQVEFDGSKLSAGVYFYNCIIGNCKTNGKLILLSN